MSVEAENQDSNYVTISQPCFEQMLSDAKSRNFTESQFEIEKTKRIVALCDVLKVCPNSEWILQELKSVCESQYVGTKVL